MLRDIEVHVPQEEGIEVLSVELVDKALTIGAWTAVRLKFKNVLTKASVFAIEAVSTCKVTPHMDKTRLLQPEEIWTQTFSFLPSKQDTVDVRMRITPKNIQAFKEKETTTTIIEFQANTKNPSSVMGILLGFSGANIGALSISTFWDQIIVSN